MKLFVKTLYRSLLLLMALPLGVLAQEDSLHTVRSRYTSHVWMVGVGATNVLDTYLSPLEYKGIEARVQRETFRQTRHMNGHVYLQTMLNAHASYSENEAKTAEMYEGLINWNIGWLYNFRINSHLRILAGPSADVNAGCIYLKRNSNNPAQAKAYINLAASGMALYQFRLAGHPYLLRYQLSTPLLGVMFSPEYGQSYYEIFTLGHSGHNVCVTTLASQPSLRQALTLDIPIHNTIIRLGYVGDYQQSHVNNIKGHTYSSAFMVGIVKNLKLIRAKDKENKNMPFYQ